MTAKHTPGPWVVGYGKTRELVGAYLAVGLDCSPDWKPVALISPEASVSPGDEANARLIAAAPELLEALEGVLVDDLLQYLPAEYIARVRAAINLATGGES